MMDGIAAANLCPLIPKTVIQHSSLSYWEKKWHIFPWAANCPHKIHALMVLQYCTFLFFRYADSTQIYMYIHLAMISWLFIRFMINILQYKCSEMKIHYFVMSKFSYSICKLDPKKGIEISCMLNSIIKFGK